MNSLLRIVSLLGVIVAGGCATEDKSPRYGSVDGRTVVSSPPISTTPSGTYNTGPYGTTYPGTSTTYPSASTTYPSSVTTYPSGTTYPTYGYTNNPGSVYTSDDSLVRQIRQQLTGYGRLGTLAQTLQLEARNGVVTLSGVVPSQQDRELIDAVVRNTPGVVSVTDQLHTSAAPTGSSSRVYSGAQPATLSTGAAGEIFSLNVQGLTPADRALAQRIMSGLEADTSLPNLLPKVNININDGRVLVNGTVQNEQQRRFIEDIVRRVAGVSAVEDQIQITAP